MQYYDEDQNSVFNRLYNDGKNKEEKYLDYQNRVKFEEQIQWFKTLKDKKLINPHKNLADLIIKLTTQQLENQERIYGKQLYD